MQRADRKVDSWRDDTALKAAIRRNDVECRGRATIDDDQVAGIGNMRSQSADNAVRADLFRPVNANLDARLQLRVTNEHWLDIEITPREVAKVEHGLRHHGGNHTAVDLAEVHTVHIG